MALSGDVAFTTTDAGNYVIRLYDGMKGLVGAGVPAVAPLALEDLPEGEYTLVVSRCWEYGAFCLSATDDAYSLARTDTVGVR